MPKYSKNYKRNLHPLLNRIKLAWRCIVSPNYILVEYKEIIIPNKGRGRTVKVHSRTNYDSESEHLALIAAAHYTNPRAVVITSSATIEIPSYKFYPKGTMSLEGKIIEFDKHVYVSAQKIDIPKETVKQDQNSTTVPNTYFTCVNCKLLEKCPCAYDTFNTNGACKVSAQYGYNNIDIKPPLDTYSQDELPKELIDEKMALLTCHTCTDKENCAYAYDPYNTKGDCLADK